MIDRQFDQIAFECGACHQVIKTNENGWADAIEIFKRARWKAEKVGDEWTHGLPRRFA